jgi:hypothetical protein
MINITRDAAVKKACLKLLCEKWIGDCDALEVRNFSF